jgi:rRNA maturation endonuclease Nob1
MSYNEDIFYWGSLDQIREVVHRCNGCSREVDTSKERECVKCGECLMYPETFYDDFQSEVEREAEWELMKATANERIA